VGWRAWLAIGDGLDYCVHKRTIFSNVARRRTWRVRRWQLLNQVLLALGLDPVKLLLQRDSSCRRALNIFVPFTVLPITASIDAFRRALRRPRRGSATVTSGIERGAGTDQVSRRCHGVQPLRCRFGSEDPERRPRDEMALIVERIVDRGMHAEEALGGRCRLEPLHLAFAPSHDLVGVLRPIIHPQPLLMTASETEVSEGGAVRSQFVGRDQLGRDARLSEQLARQP